MTGCKKFLTYPKGFANYFSGCDNSTEGGDKDVQCIRDRYRSRLHHFGAHSLGHMVVYVCQRPNGNYPSHPHLNRRRCSCLFRERDQIEIRDRKGETIHCGREKDRIEIGLK